MTRLHCALISNIVDSTWLDVFAMPSPADRRFLLDTVFKTPKSDFAITGKAHSIPDDQEAFCLLVHEHTVEGWRSGQIDREIWVPRNIRSELIDSSLTALLYPPRQVCFYGDPLMAKRLYAAKEPLDNCSAIEFLKQAGGRPCRLVVAASMTSPCSLELATSDEECDLLLMNLLRLEDAIEDTSENERKRRRGGS